MYPKSMYACLANAILLYISFVHLPLLEISESRYRKSSVCLVDFSSKESVSLGTGSCLVATRHSVLLTLIGIPYCSSDFFLLI